MLRPVVEMIRSRDRAGNALALTDTPILREGRCACDAGCVGAGVCADGIGAAVGREGSKILGVGARVVGALRVVRLGRWA